ncbi:MAG TPA: LysM peptidoglycan-binding domain-containing protein, partial [Pyrinomonadaceae bacterium]
APDGHAGRTAALSAQADAVNDLSSDILFEALLRWAIAAVCGSPGNGPATVTAGQIATLLAQMACPQTRDTFSVSNLGKFLKANAPLRISGDPGGQPPTRGGMIFPMPPPISWTSPQAGNRNFAEVNKVGPLYEWGIALYLSPYFPQERPVGPQPPDDSAAYESFASYVFRDYFLMIAKGAVQAARDALTTWRLSLSADSTLAGIANSFPSASVAYFVRAGDTVDSVAEALGASAAELEFLNPTLAGNLADAPPGTNLPIKLGVSPESVALDNAALRLTPGLPFDLGVIDYQARAGDTLDCIAQHFHLGGPAALLDGSPLADNPELLRQQATFPVPPVTYTPPAGTATLTVAATFYVRYYAPPDVPFTEWYAQTIFDLNKDGALCDVDGDGPIPAGRTLWVPPAVDAPSRSAAIPYTTVVDDTVTRVGATLSLAQNFASGGAPYPSWAQFRDAVTTGPGTVNLPDAAIVIRPRDTLNSLAARTIVNDGHTERLVGWLADSQILQPLAVVTVPNVAALSGRDGNTIGEIAAYYDLTVADFGSRVAAQTVFSAAQSPTIKHLLVQDIDTLVARVLAGDGPRQVSATTSRYFFSGLRLRAPADKAGHKVAEGPLTSLYDLTGQQFPGPSPSAPGVALEVTATLDPAADWIELVGSTVTGDDETYDALVARAPGARDLRLNPALRAERLRPGMIVHTGVINELVFSYTAGQLNYPSDGLALAPASGPAAMPLAGKNPRTYGLDHRIALQSAAALPIPIVGTAPAAGVASLWPFPAALIGRALAGVSVPYDILRSAHAGDGRDADAVQGSTYATLLPFEVSRAAGRDHLYDVRGAPDANRQTLLALRHYLTQPTTPPGTKALLLVPNAPEAANASGLVNLLTEESQTFIVKTNLSTETMSSARWRDARAAGTSGDYYASFGDLVPFVLLLWEASVVGGAGYYLNLTTTDGGDIPAGAFDERGAATLYLLVIAGEQQAPAPSGRVLLPINNCAAVAPGLDPSTHALYVEAARDEPSELVTVALVPPGNVGFTLSLPVPPTDTQEDRLRSLFSLATYEIPPGGDFSMSPSGLPAGPHRDDASLMPIWHRRRIERWRRLGRVAADDPPTPVWRFDQVLPVARFGPASAAPPVGGLPDPADDPYRGIGGTRLASADIRLGFSDVLGNITAPPATPDGAVNAVVGYTDPIAGVANWPAVTTQYEVTAQTDGTVTLTATVAPQPGAIVAAPAQSAAVAVGAAARQAEKYREPYFQLAQPNVTVSLVTSLKASPIVADGWALWRFAAASYAAAMGAASVVPKIAGGSLAEVVAAYGVTYDDLAAANADAPAASLFGVGPLAVPVFVTFADGDSAAAIVRGLGQGWPTPGSGAQLLTQNGTLPLRTGAALSIPPTPVVIQTPAPTLAALANGLGTSSSLLADDSRNDRDVLRQNFIFTMDGLTVTIGQTTIPPDGRVVNTFGEVVAAFAALGVNLTVEDLAAAFADAADMLDAGKTLHTAHYVAADGDTLEHNSSGVTVAEMAANNATTPDVFDAGALVYLGTTQGGALHGGAPETLRQFADRYACPPGQLLAANPTLVLPAGTSLVVPGSATLPNDPSALSMPYSVGEGETLAGIAVKFFGATAQTLGAANRHLPGTIAAGKAVAVGSFSTPTVANDSLQSVWQRLNQQSSSIRFEQVIDAVADAGGYLAVDSLLLCPPAQTAAGSNLTPDQIATAYHVEAVAFALSNAALLGIVAGGVTLWNRDGSVSVVTGSNDTFNAITSRFAQKGASVGVREIVVKNQDVAFIAGGALALLPPAPARLKVSLGTTVGPLPGPIVPLTTTIRIQRPAAVIDPAFKTAGQDGPVERADVTVPAPSLPTPGGPGEELTLAAFVWDFQTAFPNLRVGTGRAAGKTADLWVVDFGGDGITEVKVSPGVPMPGGEFWPRFFAPRPLYNSLVQRRGVQIRALADDGQLEPGFVPTDFQDIDVEVWARRFLADLDLFLTAPYASSVYANDGARSALDRVLAAKDTLSSAVARGLAETLVISGDPKADAGRASVVRSLEQQLKVSLSRAYDTDAVVQYDATVNSPWTRGAQLPPARLGGTAVSKPPPPAGFDDPDRVLPYTIAGAKTALDQAASFVNFLMRVPDPQRNGAVGVNLDYDFLDLEFNVTGVEGVRGYESSDWVAFFDHLTDGAPPACQTALGPTTVPIPLRNYPGLPTIIGQTARATWCDTHACDEAADPPLSQAALWTYGLTYAHEHAQQDEVEVAVTFNVQSVMRESLSTPGADVATELAKYIAVADPLWAILSGFADPQTTIPPETRAHAAMTFSTFVGDIASAWGSHWAEASDERDEPRAGLPASPSDAPAQQVYKFGVRLGYTKSEGHTYFSTLQLKKGQAQPGPGGPWPVVFYVPPDGDRVALTPGAPQGDLLIYTFPTPRPIAAADWPHINIEWPGLNVAAMQNARASLAVRRNAKLLGEGNPDTARGFLYQTNSVEAADIVSPLLTWTQQIALSGADTTGALQTAFDALFGPTTGLPLTVSIFYGYQLIQPFGDDRGVSVYLPVSLYPNQRLGPDTAATIAAATRLWDSIYRPTHAGGEWAFALTLYSQLDPAATRPLLVLDRMTYKIA